MNSLSRSRFMAGLRLYVAILSSASAYVHAQSIPTRIVAMPLPAWNEMAMPSDGITRAYFDTRRNQIVVGSKLSSGQTTEVRFDVTNGALPTITSSITATDKRRFVYSYVATDDPKSPQRTKRIGLLLPEHDSSMIADGLWAPENEQTTLPDHTGAIGFGKMRIVSWRDRSNGNAKIAAVGFRIDSNYLPGFVDALVWGQASNPLRPEVLSTVPSAAREALGRYLETRYYASKQMLIGPLFRPDTPKSVIAANYHFALQHLMKRDQLLKSSSYAQALLRNLTTFLSVPSSVFYFPQEPASAGVETQIDKALRIALGSEIQK